MSSKMFSAPGRSLATISAFGGVGNTTPVRAACWRRFSVIRALLLLLSNSLLDSTYDVTVNAAGKFTTLSDVPIQEKRPLLILLIVLILIPALVFFCGLSFLFASTVLFSSIHSVSGLVVVLHPLAGILDHLLADVHQTEELLRPGLREERDAAVGEEERPGAAGVPVAAVDGAAVRAREVPSGAGEVAVVDSPLLHLIHVRLLVVSQLPVMLDLSQSALEALFHHLIAADVLCEVLPGPVPLSRLDAPLGDDVPLVQLVSRRQARRPHQRDPAPAHLGRHPV